MSAHELIIVLDYASIFVMAVISAIICFHVESYMQKFASYAAIVLTICSIGFLFKAEATNVETLVFGQRIVYGMIPHATFAMLLFILEYCGFMVPKWANYFCVTGNMLISALAMTIPYNQLFYKSYWAVDAGGYLILEKEYAFGHTYALVVLLLYMIATFVIVSIYTVRNLKKHSRNALKLMIAVMIPYSSYIIPKLINTENELQPLTFAIFLVVILVMIYRENLYDVNNLLTRYAIASIDDALVVFNNENLFEGCNQLAKTMFPPLAGAGIETDICDEVPIFKGILSGNIKSWQDGDRWYDISIRDIVENGKNQGKTVWFEDVTLQKNYTELLKKQNESLETEVVDLFDQSRHDQLTGLANRRSFEELVEEIGRTNKADQTLIGCFDVNGLKNTNDTLGHSAGDELLCGCAGILEDVFGKEGKAFRIGGDEFAVILTDPLHPADFYAKALNSGMLTRRGNLVERFSMAYGFANGKDHPDLSLRQLQDMADQAMYENKGLMRNA